MSGAYFPGPLAHSVDALGPVPSCDTALVIKNWINKMETRVVVIGIGLHKYIPSQTVILTPKQPIDKVPIHPIYNVPDLEDPPGTIDWSAFREEFQRFRSPDPFVSNQPELSDTSSLMFDTTLPNELLDEWRVDLGNSKRKGSVKE
ncbi:hypothetical protein FRC12_001775 [Ceratobasidium sp. 428]|nr:hypothetical protein FRC12_001775 [Ceratobasidium sp. 428]